MSETRSNADVPTEPLAGRPAERRPHAVPRLSARLLAGSATVLLATGVAYGASVPGLMSALATRLADANSSSSVSLGWVADAINGGPSDQGSGDAENGDASAAGAAGSAAGLNTSNGLTSRLATLALSTASRAEETAKTEAASSSSSSGTSAGSGSGSGASSPTTNEASDSISTPSAAEEESYHSYLVGVLGTLNSQCEQLNACVDTFNARAYDAPLSERRSYYQQAQNLSAKIFNEFGSMRMHLPPDNSKWSEAANNLVGAYNRLWRYSCDLSNAWSVNVEYDDPYENPNDWREPMDVTGAQDAQEFQYFASRVSL